MKKEIKITKKPTQNIMRVVGWKPEIKLSGKYLLKFGFEISDIINVVFSQNQIIITK
jgi:hypothetical protein